MKTKPVGLISALCSQTGFIFGIALGIGSTMIPIGLFLAYAFQNPYAMIGGLAPQAIATLSIMVLCPKMTQPLRNENDVVEALLNLIVSFLMGILFGVFALPIFIVIMGGWLLYVFTRDKKWLSNVDTFFLRTTGVDISEAGKHSDPKN